MPLMVFMLAYPACLLRSLGRVASKVGLREICQSASCITEIIRGKMLKVQCKMNEATFSIVKERLLPLLKGWPI